MQRLQRHATYGHFKQMVLQIIADDVIDNGHDPDKVFATLRSAPFPLCQAERVLSLMQQAGSGGPCLYLHALASHLCHGLFNPSSWCMHSSAGV